MSGSGAAALYSIAPGIPFLDALAAGLLAEAGDEPLALPRIIVLLPTRRSCRAMQEALLRRSEGRPLLLPRLVPLGDLDPEEPAADLEDTDAGWSDALDAPAIAPLRRLLLLTRAVFAAAGASIDQSARLAQELARLIDRVQTEELSFDRLAGVVPEEHALHWQRTLKFLEIVTRAWPEILAEEGALDPADRRNRLLRARAEAWRRHPPAHPVIAAGSTGSIPATAALLAVIARLPQGRVVLPGLDRGADDDTWAAIRDDPAHSQHGMAQLLASLGCAPSEVRDWPYGDRRAPAARARILAEALRPAATAEAWREDADEDRERMALALAGVTRIDCPTPQEEAGAIALLLREALEVPGRRAALVTPDRELARRVQGELLRWDIRIDDSAGRPLAATPPGTFLRLVAQAIRDRVAPVPLLAMLKHPLAAGGRDPAEFRRLARRVERLALRGPRPAPGWAGLKSALGERPDTEPAVLIDELAADAAPFAAAMDAEEAPLARLLASHVTFAEALAASDKESGPERLWAGEAGAAAAAFVAELGEAARDLPPIEGAHYPALLSSLIAGRVVRPRFGSHPRLAIWGPLEARLQSADLLILGGLNEGTWPAEPPVDPWLSRPMLKAFGLPAPERRVGQAAHDFAEACMAPEAVLTRSRRVDGTPTVPSRWLTRLDAYLASRGLKFDLGRPATLLDWQALLDRAPRLPPARPPAPRPPVAARPRTLSVTAVETWMRDPYAIYARRILGLKPLDPLDADPGAAERGELIHAILERFQRRFPVELPADALPELLRLGEQAFAAALARPSVWAFWWPRFERIARWFIDTERALRGEGRLGVPESTGSLVVAGPAGDFTLTARADRIDRLALGSLAIVDYKTGTLPTPKEVALGFAPQLPLEAAIAAAGGFEGIAGPVAELAFWRLTGGDPPGEIRRVEGDPAQLAADALAGLRRLIALFDDPATPYESRPRPGYAPRYSDYEHLARVKEWAAGEGAE